jgi:hypothetical protein
MLTFDFKVGINFFYNGHDRERLKNNIALCEEVSDKKVKSI